MSPKRAENVSATGLPVTLSSPNRGCGWLLIAFLAVELISALSYHLSAAFLGDFSFESFQHSVVESMSLGTRGALYLLAGILMSSSGIRLAVDRRAFTMRRLLISTRVDLNRGTELWFYPSFPDLDPETGSPRKMLAGSYCLEDGEQSLLFRVHPNQLLSEGVRRDFEQLLEETERVSGRRWITLADPLARRHLPELMIGEQLSNLTGRRGWSLVRWLVENSLAVHLSRSGVITSQALLSTITLWAILILVVAVAVDPWWQMAMLTAAYMTVCLSMNLLVLIIGTQRRQRERVQGELEAGSDIQRQLLPTEIPNIPGFHLDASYTPAREIAGDYWDVVEIEPGRWAVVIADVAGKGVPAALVASLAKGHLSSSLRSGAEPLEALEALNRAIRIAPKRRGRLFMTMVLLVLDITSGRVSVARAGHEPPLVLRRGGRLESIEPRGLAIGIDPGPRFRSAFDLAEIELADGESMILFTDGLTEAANPKGEQYGHERLRTLIEDEIPKDGSGLSSMIIDGVSAFREGAEPSDDLTLIVLRRAVSEHAQ